jgi:DNA-binding response OmpR family regulator
MTTRILVVDDEPAVRDLLVYNLRKAHYEVLTAGDGRQALQVAQTASPDLVLLDLMLPAVDGLDVCRELRKTSDVPIIMVTARGEEIDRVVGLELGADDYIAKPFSVREVLARVKAVLRRSQGNRESPAPDPVLAGPNGLIMNTAARTVTVREKELDLTQLEFDLLYHLLANAGRVLSRERLLEQVWGYDYIGDTRAVDSAIKRLRSKLRAALGAETEAGEMIETVRGIGYRLEA